MGYTKISPDEDVAADNQNLWQCKRHIYGVWGALSCRLEG